MYRIRFQLLFVVALVVVFSNSNAQTIYVAATKPDNSGSSSILEAQATGSGAGIPRLTNIEGRTQLMVDGSPFVILGGQALNSSASNLDDIEHVYKVLDVLHANTAEIPISWNLLEREPGQFEFQLVDGAIERAGAQGKRI